MIIYLELQGDDSNEGLVFSEFIEFQPLAEHSKSKMPLTKKLRSFFFDGGLLDWFEYWDESEYFGNRPPKNVLADGAYKIESRFFYNGHCTNYCQRVADYRTWRWTSGRLARQS